ncbi:MAG: hypothetical protein QM706_00810 [Nitrospira sp.]
MAKADLFATPISLAIERWKAVPDLTIIHGDTIVISPIISV